MDHAHEHDHTQAFEAERPRLIGLATRILGDHAEAQDIAQQAWLRLHGTDARIDSLPAWLTTVTSRLFLDRLKSRTPEPHDEVDVLDRAPDTADAVALADTVGIALKVVIDRLTPGERVAFATTASASSSRRSQPSSTPPRLPPASSPPAPGPRSASPRARTG
ncbi:sigma factor [Janibacter cremeus]|uniref:DNA-directed RNA polymerase specialized sigma24 family protein n=1 Tax=Janibacter cremeus TaxID=1285192 RepID=A0A852VM79_9MICO|nr:DNA-directed RNA polymerase specialized sigma24 family protein [Janibacter cremeus]